MKLGTHYYVVGLLTILLVTLFPIIYPPGGQGGISGHATIDSSLAINNSAPVITTDPLFYQEGDLINLSDIIYDPNLDTIIFNLTSPFNNSGLWQTSFEDAGVYIIIVNVSDGQANVSASVTITILDVVCSLSADLNTDMQSVDLNWGVYVGNSTYGNHTIYYGSDLNGDQLLLATASTVTTTATNWTDVNASNVQRRYYQLLGHNQTASTFCPIVVGKYDRDFNTTSNITNATLNLTQKNWYLVSLPFIPENNSMNNVFIQALGNIEFVTHYNISASNWDYFNYTSSTGTLEFLFPGQSYLIRTFDNITVTFVGTLYTNDSITLQANTWNPFGWVHQDVARSTLTNMVTITWMYAYNDSNANWTYWYAPFSKGDLANLRISEGYLVKTETSQIINPSIS